jgi:hypothetical protein
MPRDRASEPPADIYPSVWQAIDHETKEELGGRVRPGSQVVLGAAREGTNYEVGILGYGMIDARANDLAGASRGAARARIHIVDRPLAFDVVGIGSNSPVNPGIDQSVEVVDYIAVPFRPREVFDFVLRYGSFRGATLENPASPPREIVPWENVMPLGAFSWLMALAYDHRDQGGWDYLSKEWLLALERAQGAGYSVVAHRRQA